MNAPDFANAYTLTEQAFAYRLLDNLIEQPDVYQVNVYKQLRQYCATLTLTPTRASKARQHILNGNGGLGPESRTISCWGGSPYAVLVELTREYDERRIRNGPGQVGQAV